MQMPHAATAAAAAVGCVVYMNFGVNFQLSLFLFNTAVLAPHYLKWGHSPIDAKTHFPQGGKYTNHLRTQTQL